MNQNKAAPQQINVTRNDIAKQVASGTSTAMVNPIELQSVSQNQYGQLENNQNKHPNSTFQSNITPIPAHISSLSPYEQRNLPEITIINQKIGMKENINSRNDPSAAL